MNQKIIFFDIDGTLFDPEIGVPENTKKAIQQLNDNGHIPIICTGRTKAMIPDDLIDIGFTGIVCGAGTYIEYNGEIIHHKVEGAEYAKHILALLKEKQIKYIVEGPEYVYYDSSDVSEEYGFAKSFVETIGKDKVKPIQNGNIRMNKISCSLTKYSDLESILPKLEEKFHLIRHQGTDFIELVPNGYNKATGIQKLINFLNIERENTYAFGDSTNDLEMLEYVEYGIAMGNSYPEVLEMAKYKTKSIKEDGIYYGLKEFGLI